MRTRGNPVRSGSLKRPAAAVSEVPVNPIGTSRHVTTKSAIGTGAPLSRPSRGVVAFSAATPALSAFLRPPSLATARDDERVLGSFACGIELARPSTRHGSRWTTGRERIASQKLVVTRGCCMSRRGRAGESRASIRRPIINHAGGFAPFQRRNRSAATAGVRLYHGRVRPGAAITMAIIVDYRRSEHTPVNENGPH